MSESSNRDTRQAQTDSKELTLDADGFLKRLNDWSETVANSLAANEGFSLDAAHWEVIHLLRAFYRSHQVAPANRALVNLVKKELGSDKGQSRYLMRLFGGSPAKTAAKLAGLPKPENCL